MFNIYNDIAVNKSFYRSEKYFQIDFIVKKWLLKKFFVFLSFLETPIQGFFFRHLIILWDSLSLQIREGGGYNSIKNNKKKIF